MAIYTLSEIDEELSALKAAVKALTLGKEYTAGGKTLKREDLFQIREQMKWLDSQRKEMLSGTGGLCINVGMVRR